MGEEGRRVLLEREGVWQRGQVLHQVGVATAPQAIPVK